MPRLSRLLSWLAIDASEPDVVVAQFHQLQRQVPLLYALLVVNAVAVSYTHYGLAPDALTLIVPATLFMISMGRLGIWLRRRNLPITPEKAVRELRRTTILGAIISVAYIAWSLELDAYGGPYERGHVSVFIAITVIGCIFCLMHLPQAALVVTAIVTIPYFLHYTQTGNAVFLAVALNMLLVTAVMIQVLLNSFHGFTKLIRSQAALAAKQAETERLSEENARLAQTDPLTGLPNRRYFFSRLDSEIEAARRAASRFSVGVLDLDRFKPINDTYGHVVGDRLLEEVGRRLVKTAGPQVVVCRLGGDEFGIVAAMDGEAAQALAQRICHALAEPYLIEGAQLQIGCSCGLAVFPDVAATAHELFDRSDYALYNAKTAGHGIATLYSQEHEQKIRAERALETALQSADLETELAVHLQPIVDTRLQRVVAVEALARWTSPTLGPVRPDVFISVAEKAGLMHNLTLVLFQKALRQMESLPQDLTLSFNLSAQDVTSSQTVIALLAMIRQAKIGPERIILELTETAVMRNFEVASHFIRLLRSLGVKIALDDFGTGYSSLGYLHRLPIDKVKIDRSFVLDLGHASGRNIVGSIVGLCRNLSLECVVEGVETTAQLATLREMGCGVFQGYLFSKPMPQEALVEWLASHGDGHEVGAAFAALKSVPVAYYA